VALFGDKPVAGGPRELAWPAGFLLSDPSKTVKRLTGAKGMAYALEGHWSIEKWEMRVEPTASGAHTKLTFHAEAEFEGNMGIHQHKDSQKAAAEWFFEYLNKPWYKSLTAKLEDFRARHKEEVEPIRFREWEFYCGNGGGGGE
jgi:hypothetical protein